MIRLRGEKIDAKLRSDLWTSGPLDLRTRGGVEALKPSLCVEIVLLLFREIQRAIMLPLVVTCPRTQNALAFTADF